MIYLHTLGDTLIKVGEKEVRPSAPLVFAALLYLSVERGRRVPRAALQELFFPESDERSGSHSVRQLLYKLRQLGAPILTDAASVCIQASSVVDRCLLDDSPKWSDGEAALAALGFAPDYKPTISERFGQWLENYRTIISSRVRAALVASLLDRRGQANWRGVTSIAQSLLIVDPLNEEATLALAEATAAVGGKTEALDILATYEAETATALRVAPSLLRRRISDNVIDLNTSDSLPTPLFGRQEELRVLVQRLVDFSTVGPRICAIVGEPGIGKSRLAEEVIRSCAVSGIRPIIAQCRVHHTSRPLSVFIEIVPALLQSPGALGVNPESLRYLRKLIHNDPSADTSTELEDDVARSEVLRCALIDLIDAITSEQHVLFVVEDFHWCDPASQKELRFIASHALSQSFLLTSRSADCLQPCFVDLAEVVRLRPLADNAMNEMAHFLLGDRSENSTRQWCSSIASGNPLFLRMLCSHVRESGQCSVPKDLTTIVARRLELIEDQQLRALQYVALLGSYATIASLKELLGLAPGPFIECLSQLEEQGYLVERDNRIALQHDLVSEAAIRSSSLLTRRALHAHVASFLEGNFEETGNTTVMWDCAEQWRLSGETKRSIGLLRRCAAHASTLGQSSKALDILRHASSLTTDARNLADLLTEMMLAAKAAGQLYDCLEIKQRLSPHIYETHSDAELIGIEAEWLLKGFLDVEMLLRCASNADVPTHHRFEACLLLQRYAHENCHADLADRAFDAVRNELTVAEPQHRLLLEVVYHATFGDSTRAVRAIDELSALLPRLKRIGDQLRAARSIVIGLLILGRPADAIVCAENSRKRASDLGLSTRQYEFTILIAACHIATNAFAVGERCLSELASPPDLRLLNLHRQLSFELSLWHNDAGAARDLLEALESTGYGDTTRNKAYMAGATLRLKQLEQRYICSEEEFADALAVYEQTKRFVADDDLVSALAEDLRRRHRPAAALQIMNDYVTNARRQSFVLPVAFESLRSSLRVSLGNGSAA